MPKYGVSVRFTDTMDATSYDPDFDLPIGTGIELTSSFFIPQGLQSTITAAQLQALGLQAGWQLCNHGYRGNKEIINDCQSACPVSKVLTPRKLIFGMNVNGQYHTMGVPFVGRTAIVQAARNMKQTLESWGAVNVICINLVGEQWNNVTDFIPLSDDGSSTIGSGGSGTKYSAVMNYKADHKDGAVIAKSFQLDSSQGSPPGSEPPPVFRSDCVELASAGRGCGSAAGFRHRRYIIDYRTDVVTSLGNGISEERREQPVSENDAASILICGEAIAALPGVFCIGYEGESRRNLEREVAAAT